MTVRYNRVLDHVGPFEVIGTDNPKDPVGLRDRTGRWVVSPEMGFKSFSAYDDGLMIANISNDDGYGWVLVDYFGNIISDRYNYIHPTGEGYFSVEKGARRNIMRRDGSLVLNEWPHRVGKIRNGYFSIGKTIRKTKTTPTRYIEGIAHVSGMIVFPMIFSSVLESRSSGFIVKKDGEQYQAINGALIDLQMRHLPSVRKSDEELLGKLFENIANWTLPGLQFFYKDTDAPILAEAMYPVGKVLRTGDYITVSTKLQKPAHKTRFLIAGAHAALLCSDENGKSNKRCLDISPRAEEWRHAMFHKNVWLKVLDIYHVGNVTQIFMIQIPETVAKLFGDNEMLFNFFNESGEGGFSLIEMARRSLDDKMLQSVHPRSLDKDLVKLMEPPIGYDSSGKPYSLAAELLYDKNFKFWNKAYNGKEWQISSHIHWLAKDSDILLEYEGFPWTGVNNSICEGCIFSTDINGEPFGCGKLKTVEFRNNYTNGECRDRKENAEDESANEFCARLKREREEEFRLKTSGEYARCLLKDFIREHLDGNIDNILNFDFGTLKEDKKYGPIKGPGMVVNFAIVKSIAEVAFRDYWPDLNVETLDEYQYQVSNLIQYQRLSGARIQKGWFKTIKEYFPQDEGLAEMSEALHSLTGCIGNFVVWPNKSCIGLLVSDYKMRGYYDKLFLAMYDVMTGESKINFEVFDALNANRKLFKEYQGAGGFTAMMRNNLLEDFMDENGKPLQLFDGVSNSARDFRPELLPAAIKQYHDFMGPMVEKRSKEILKRLKSKLN